MITASAVLGERITATAVAGAALILCGVRMAEKRSVGSPNGRKYSRPNE